jgi:hypothetical protein
VYPHVDNTAYLERENYYDCICDDYYSEVYDLLTNDPTQSFGEIEAKYNMWYGKANVNRGELETAYELAREDILFFDEEKQRKTTKVLNK